MKVGFMVIGAQKCGTTSLAHQLAQHPEICFCKKKEPNFFSTVGDWRGGLDEYHRLYEGHGGRLCGEASPQYTFLPEYLDTHRRIYEYNPKVKLVYIVRQPVDRVASHYAHRHLAQVTQGDPDAEVLARADYVNRSRYAVQIRPYYDLFPAENIRVLTLDEYATRPREVLRDLARFLDVDPGAIEGIDLTPQNVSVQRQFTRFPQLAPVYRRLRHHILDKGVRARLRRLVGWAYFGRRMRERPDLSPHVRQVLWQLLEDDVRALEDLTGLDLADWSERPAEKRTVA